MHLNEITYEHINRLSAVNLPKVLHRLLILEAQTKKFSGVDKIFVPLRINVGDGGDDGRIHCTNTNGSLWILNAFSIFQCKATSMDTLSIYNEFFTFREIINPKPGIGKKKKKREISEVKLAIKEVLDAGGHYVFFIGRDYNSSTIIPLISGAQKAINDSNVNFSSSYNIDQVRFLDSNQIASWCNEHYIAALYVLSLLNDGRPSFIKTWEILGNYKYFDLVYETNNYIENIIKNIRESISVPKNVVRIVGLSGLGKTRLIYEAFKFDSIDYKGLELKQAVLYCDFNDSNKAIKSLISNYCSTTRVILIVDNCPLEFHKELYLETTRSDSNFSLITIDYDIEKNSPRLNEKIILIENKKIQEVVPKIVENIFTDRLLPAQKALICEYAEGFPQIAVLFSECEVLNITYLPDIELTKKIVFGYRPLVNIEFEVLKICSVFKYVPHPVQKDILDIGQFEYYQRQKEAIISLVQDLSENQFDYVVEFYINRGLIERRGVYLSIKPTILALKLAALWWDEVPDHIKINVLFPKILNSDLSTQFVDRLKTLDCLDSAKDFTPKYWGAARPFSKAEVLNTELGSRLFRSIVEVNPESAIEALEFTFNNYSKDEFKAFILGRRNLVWAIEKLVFRNNLFQRSAKLLSCFAIAENENIGNNATGQFIQLFQSFLPGTEANYDSRMVIIDWCLSQSNESDYIPLAINCMGRGLVAHHLHRMGGPETQGLSTILKDYEPEYWNETFKYWQEIITRLTNIAISKIEYKELAMKTIANSIRTLLSFHQSKMVYSCLITLSEKNDNLWEDAIQGLKYSLSYENLTDPEIEIVNELIDRLLPNNFKNKLKYIVSLPHYDSYKEENGKMIDFSESRVIEFSQEIVNSKLPLEDQLQVILEGKQCWAILFGKEIGKSEFAEKLLYKSFELLKSLPEEKRNPDFIAGLAISIEFELINKFIDFVIEDSILYNYAIYFTTFIKPQKLQLFKLFQLIDNKKIEINSFSRLTYGRPFENLNSLEVIEFCTKISEYGPIGVVTSFNVLEQYVLFDDQKWQESIIFIRLLIFKIGNPVKPTNQSLDYYKWSKAITKTLDNTRDNEMAIFISELLFNSLGDTNNHSQEIYFLEISKILISQYFDIFWNIVSPALISDSIHYLNFKYLFGSHNGNNKRDGILFTHSDLNKIFEWCKLNCPKGPKRLAYIMPIYNSHESIFDWHPFALRIINEFGDLDGLMSEIGSNMGSYGWTGSVVSYFEQMQKLSEQLLQHPFNSVKIWAQKNVENYKKDILHQKLIDDQLYL